MLLQIGRIEKMKILPKMTYSAVPTFIFLLHFLLITTCATPDLNSSSKHSADYQTPQPLTWACLLYTSDAADE